MWQPIETAPKDGTEILGAFSEDYGYLDKPTQYGPWSCRYDGKKWMASYDGFNVVEYMSDFGTEYKETDIDPTHWMPMPDLPT